MKKGMIKISLIASAGILFMLSGVVLAVDRMKLSEFFVAGFQGQVSSVTSTSFTIYIGDNITVVTSSVKSAYLVVSGSYTGGGTLQFDLNSDSNTIQTFTLPTVSSYTPFEILYIDPSNKINPTSAGSYTYTLNVTPAGVTISGLGVKVKTTHRYAPKSCDDGQSNNEKIKTSEFFVAGYQGQVSSATSSQFSIFIGDNITNVTNSVKSVEFITSGAYTGGGTLQFDIDGSANTTKIFTLPTVSSLTSFEIIYKDDSNKINPTSAGSYTYTLNFVPSGVTISGLGAKVEVSHRYKPPSCGLPATAELISAIFETTGGNGPAFNSVLWKGNLGGSGQNQGRVRIQMAASDSSGGPWTFVGGSTCGGSDWYEPSGPDVAVEIGCFSNFNNKRFFKYHIQICSDNCVASGSFTPIVKDVVVSWSP